MKELHVRGLWIGIKQVVFGFLEELAKKRGWQIREDLPDDFPLSSGWIKLFTQTLDEPVVEVSLKQINDTNWLSLKWQSPLDEMEGVFDELVEELRDKCPEVKIVSS